MKNLIFELGWCAKFVHSNIPPTSPLKILKFSDDLGLPPPNHNKNNYHNYFYAGELLLLIFLLVFYIGFKCFVTVAVIILYEIGGLNVINN